MSKPTILITAAAGNTGFPTVLKLLEHGYPVRVLLRRPSARGETLRGRGAEIVFGSLDDIADVRRALEGVQRAYFCPPLLPGLLDKAAVFAAAAEEQRLEVVVGLSQWLADPSHPSIHTRQAWLAETILRRMRGVGSAFVDPGWFADNYMAALEPIAQFGLMPMPLGQGRNAPPSNEDIAGVVAAMLAEPADHVGRTYRPTGPALLSPEEIAATFARVLDRPVRYQNAPVGLFAKVAKGLGFPDYTTAQVLHYFADYQRDAFAAGAPTDVVLELTGRPPENFETIVRRYTAHSPYAERTLGPRLRATLRLTRAMLSRAPDLDVIARTSDYAIPNTALAADSPSWLASHAFPIADGGATPASTADAA